jgi:predicted nuclease with TOPRIM domain
MIKEREVMKEELYQKKNELMNSIHSIHQEQKEENESLKEISMANSSIKNTIASWKNEIIYMEKIIRDN